MKLLIALAGLLVAVAVAGGLALATVGGSSSDTPAVDVSGPCDEAEHANDPRCTGTQPREDVGTTTTTGGLDISGPCDEAEHANDPRCTGKQVPQEPGPTTTTDGVDISGPCDEAEHANDPRCTGAVTDDDGRRNRGPGGGDDREDRSGPSGDSD